MNLFLYEILGFLCVVSGMEIDYNYHTSNEVLPPLTNEVTMQDFSDGNFEEANALNPKSTLTATNDKLETKKNAKNALRSVFHVPEEEKLPKVQTSSETSLKYMMSLYEKMNNGQLDLPENVNTIRSVMPATGGPQRTLLYHLNRVGEEKVVSSSLHMEGFRKHRRPARIVVEMEEQQKGRSQWRWKPEGKTVNEHKGMVTLLDETPMDIDISSLVHASLEHHPPPSLLVHEEQLRRGIWRKSSGRHLKKRSPLIILYNIDPSLMDGQTLRQVIKESRYLNTTVAKQDEEDYNDDYDVEDDDDDEEILDNDVVWLKDKFEVVTDALSRKRRDAQMETSQDINNNIQPNEQKYKTKNNTWRNRRLGIGRRKYRHHQHSQSINNENNPSSRDILNPKPQFGPEYEFANLNDDDLPQDIEKNGGKSRKEESRSKSGGKSFRRKYSQRKKIKFVRDEYPHLGNLLPPLEVYDPLPVQKIKKDKKVDPKVVPKANQKQHQSTHPSWRGSDWQSDSSSSKWEPKRPKFGIKSKRNRSKKRKSNNKWKKNGKMKKIPDHWLQTGLNQINNDAAANSLASTKLHPNAIDSSYTETLSNQKPASISTCSRHDLYVDFKHLGWEKYIVTPKGFSTFYCDGSCKVPLNSSARKNPERCNIAGTNHAIVQSLLRSIAGVDEPGKSLPEACCIPQGLEPLTVLMIEKNNQVFLKTLPNMIVRSCSCQ